MEATFSLDRFEQCVYTRAHDDAVRHLALALVLLQAKRGAIDADFSASNMALSDHAALRHRFWTRMASAVTTLFADPQFAPSPDQAASLFEHHALVAALFNAARLGNADHIARYLVQSTGENTPANNFLVKYCLLYSVDSELELDLELLWRYDPLMTVRFALALLSPAFVGSHSAQGKRETLLEWLPGKLRQIDELDDLPSAIIHHAYMYCSYAQTPRRHDIKRDINVLVRRKLQRLGLYDVPAGTQPKTPRSKPLMVVVLEWFSSGHSIYRTHSRTLAAAREHFEIVAFGCDYALDDVGRALFDRFIAFRNPDYIGDCLKTVVDFAREEAPDVMYMPSVGMFVLSVFMSNLRIAPLQIAALGHPATTHSEQIDYISVEEDYIGDPACFSEKLLRLPKDGQPYRPSELLPNIVGRLPAHRDRLKVIVTASAMKLNPDFLDACRTIGERATTPVTFHFMTGQNEGVWFDADRPVIEAAVPGAQVHGMQSYADYLDHVNDADLFLSPFPFGNTNGIVDAVTLGLPGINKRGAEVFECIDSALFARAGLPGWLSTDSVEGYIDAAVRLIDDRTTRETLRRQMIDSRTVQRFFEGRPETFGEQVLALVKHGALPVSETAKVDAENAPAAAPVTPARPAARSRTKAMPRLADADVDSAKQTRPAKPHIEADDDAGVAAAREASSPSSKAKQGTSKGTLRKRAVAETPAARQPASTSIKDEAKPRSPAAKQKPKPKATA